MVSPFAVAHACASAHGPGEDRIALIERDDAVIVVVADGAGGISGGARAAELFVQLVREAVAAPTFDVQGVAAWTELLARADLALEADPLAGETTAIVVAAIERGPIVGASSGDSGAWVIGADGSPDDLTAHQHRKLRLGSGRARPVVFSRPRLVGTLLVATDGLFNYAEPERIAAVAREAGQGHELIQLVRLPSGGLQDDAAVVLVREWG